MKKNSSVFLCVNERRLYMDSILAEFRYPILFTCQDNKGDMYLVTCFHADSREKDWLIARTAPDQVIALLCNQISIRDAFPYGSSSIYLAKKAAGMESVSVKCCRADEAPEEIFPTPEMFMDADDDEYQEEIAILRKRISLSKRSDEMFSEVGRQAGQFSRQIYTVAYSPRTIHLEDTAFWMTGCEKWWRLYEHV